MAGASELDRKFMAEAMEEARRGFEEGGIPIGAVIVVAGKVIGRGRNRRVQEGNPILHGEMDAFRNAGRQGPEVYRRATIYTTNSPCTMCSGTIVLFRLPRVVIGEPRSAQNEPGEQWLRSHRVEVVHLELQECRVGDGLMAEFIRRFPEVWNEDIGGRHAE